MSTDNARTVPFSESAFQRGTVVGGGNSAAPANTERSSQVWVEGEVIPREPRAPAPSTSTVEPVGQGRVEGAALDTFRAGILQSARTKSGELIRGRDVAADDVVSVTTPSGRDWTIPVRLAEQEGWLYRDERGRYHEADRNAQMKVVAEMAQLERSKIESDAFRHDPDVEMAVRAQAEAMEADGLSWADELASYLGSDGQRVSDPAAQWGIANDVDVKDEMRKYTWALRGAVTSEVLQPAGIDPEAFIAWLDKSGMHRSRGVRAALYAHTFRSLNGFHELAREFLDTGGRARQTRV
jgi:hypothetical protein